jgi:hypothetical protein
MVHANARCAQVRKLGIDRRNQGRLSRSVVGRRCRRLSCRLPSFFNPARPSASMIEPVQTKKQPVWPTRRSVALSIETRPNQHLTRGAPQSCASDMRKRARPGARLCCFDWLCCRAHPNIGIRAAARPNGCVPACTAVCSRTLVSSQAMS